MGEPHHRADGEHPLHIAGKNLYSLWDCGTYQWVQWVGTGQCLEVFGNGARFAGGPFDLYLEEDAPFLVSREWPDDDRFIHSLSGAFEYDLDLRPLSATAAPEWCLVRTADPASGICSTMADLCDRVEPLAIRLRDGDLAFDSEWFYRPAGVYYGDMNIVLTYTCALPWVLQMLVDGFKSDFIC